MKIKVTTPLGVFESDDETPPPGVTDKDRQGAAMMVRNELAAGKPLTLLRSDSAAIIPREVLAQSVIEIFW